MELYQYSWLILLAPLFSFAVIIFGTRVWDMLSRPHTAVASASGGHDEHVGFFSDITRVGDHCSLL